MFSLRSHYKLTWLHLGHSLRFLVNLLKKNEIIFLNVTPGRRRAKAKRQGRRGKPGLRPRMSFVRYLTFTNRTHSPNIIFGRKKLTFTKIERQEATNVSKNKKIIKWAAVVLAVGAVGIFASTKLLGGRSDAAALADTTTTISSVIRGTIRSTVTGTGSIATAREQSPVSYTHLDVYKRQKQG